MSEATRILGLLIHDVRTPLGVALGYLRMLKDRRLDAPDERERAIDRARDALARISRLCEEADAMLEGLGDGASVRVPASRLVDSVMSSLAPQGVVLTSDAIEKTATIGVVASVDRLADAVTLLLSAAGNALGGGPSKGETTIRADVETNALRLVAGRAGGVSVTTDGMIPFDPWCGEGFALPLACRVVEEAGGRVLTTSDTQDVLVITLPLETTAA